MLMAAPTKDFVFCANIIGNGGSGKEPPDGGGSGQTRVSFKEMAMANREALPQRPKVDLIKEKLAKIVLVRIER